MAKKIVTTRGRNRKTPEEKAAFIDEKIAKLQADKEEILRPVMYKKVVDMAAEQGLSPEEMIARLGLK